MSTDLSAPPHGTLRELEAKLYEAHDAISSAIEAGEEPPAEALAMQRSFGLAVGEKREAMAGVLRDLDGQAEYAAEQVKYWQEVERRRAARASRLREFLVTLMLENGITKVRGVTTTFSVVQNPPHVEIEQPDMLPAEMLRVIPARTEPDKVAIKKALTDGQDVPGARLVAGNARLVVR